MSTSLVQEHKQLTELIKGSQLRLQIIESDAGFKVELEFETQLRELLNEYAKALPDIIAILDPSRAPNKTGAQALGVKKTRRAREIKKYRNPLTGEVVETKGGNNSALKAWKQQFGKDEVDSWVQK